jgi:hypothetical protein
MLMALVLAAACTHGTPEGRHGDVISAKPKKVAGCWAQLEGLAKKGWDKARAQVADADVQPCLGEARNALEKFKDEAALREWLTANGVAVGLPKDAHVVSVRHALYYAGLIVDVALEQSGEQPLRPVDGMTITAGLAPELKGARFLDDMPKTVACPKQKAACTEDCHPIVPMMISLGDKCFSLDVKAMNCPEEQTQPYVLEQVKLLNLALEDVPVRFLAIDKGAAVVFGPKAGLKAARDAELLSAADEPAAR